MKCNQCGGFFPWEGWDKFFSATASPGNGGEQHYWADQRK